jgi:hypothetical protein
MMVTNGLLVRLQALRDAACHLQRLRAPLVRLMLIRDELAKLEAR